ncbi:hypothetical protein Tco_0856813 [Tanacetum coccineum]|uniref:Uncharacterized protein n=1 Tax=Tanacetum coccineum TaxID=301880 RepID=A0ABQ5B4D8_9ASTR
MLTDEIKQSEAYKEFISYSTGSIPPKKSRVTSKPTCVDESDESDGEPAKRQLEEEDHLVLNELVGKFTTSSEGVGTVPEVPDDGKGSSTTKADTKIDWGLKDYSHQSDDEHVNEGDITWLSTDEEEKGNKDDDEDDNDRSIDIEEIDDERTDSENGEEEEEQANDDQAQEDQAEDDIVGTHVTMSQKEKPEVPRSSSSHSSSSNYATKAPNAPIPLSEALTAVLQRVSTPEKDVKELKQVDHTTVIVESIRS